MKQQVCQLKGSKVMKRGIQASLAMLLCSLFVMLGTLAEETKYFNIADLRKNTPAFWQQSYQAFGRAIDIHVEIGIPDVQFAPMLQVSKKKALDKSAITHWLTVFGVAANETAQVDSTGKYWSYFGSDDDRTAFVLSAPAANEALGETWDKVIESESSILGFDMNQSYAPRNTLKLSEALGIAKGSLHEVMGQDHDFELDTVAISGLYNRKTGKPIRDIDGYRLGCMPMLEGIPCLEYPVTGPDWMRSRVTATIYSKTSYDMNCSLFDVDRILMNDLPLCSFDLVKKAFEDLIMDGRIRRIFSLQLSYGKFFDQHKGFVMLPVWNAWCEVYSTAKDEMNSFDKLSKSFYKMSSYNQVIVNAQTGTLLFLGANDKGKSWREESLSAAEGVPHVLIWEHVQ